jgi:hypothetical protein
MILCEALLGILACFLDVLTGAHGPGFNLVWELDTGELGSKVYVRLSNQVWLHWEVLIDPFKRFLWVICDAKDIIDIDRTYSWNLKPASHVRALIHPSGSARDHCGVKYAY